MSQSVRRDDDRLLFGKMTAMPTKVLRSLAIGLTVLLGLAAAWTWLTLNWNYAEG